MHIGYNTHIHGNVTMKHPVQLSYIFLIFYYFLFIHMCLHCLGHFSPLPPTLSLFPLPPSFPGRTSSALFSNFVEEKT
jgi:hypothetical protein